MHQMIKNFVFMIVVFLVGCIPVSHIVVGDAREPIDPSSVKIYLDSPKAVSYTHLTLPTNREV